MSRAVAEPVAGEVLHDLHRRDLPSDPDRGYVRHLHLHHEDAAQGDGGRAGRAAADR